MAEYTEQEWARIHAALDADEARWGLPYRDYGSVVFGSFNIRKLGSAGKRNEGTWRLLTRVCQRIDLLAVQEVLADLSGLYELKRRLGDDYGMVVSDVTGVFPGDRGNPERLAFLYRRSVVRREDVVSDATYDRSKVLQTLLDAFPTIEAQVDAYRVAMGVWEERVRAQAAAHADAVAAAEAAGDPRPRTPRKPTRPTFSPGAFLGFIRQPYAVAFTIPGHPEATPYRFTAVNAHLLYGNSLDERKLEFRALMDWIVGQLQHSGNNPFPGVVLLGDLNLDFNDPASDIDDIRGYLQPFTDDDGRDVRVRFPFLDPHPTHGLLRTNARLKETYDHIALCYRPQNIPEPIRSDQIRTTGAGPDYGVFNFAALFAHVLHGTSVAEVPNPRSFYARFEHEVSDHLPIWVRVPMPY